MGSGKILKQAIEKYGLENFQKEILFQFDNENEMNAKEAELVTEEFVKEYTNYNLCPGGKGGFGYINSSGKNLYGMNGKTPNAKDNLDRGRQTQKTLRESDKEWRRKVSEKISKSLVGRPGTFLGKVHTDETKLKISEKNTGNIPWNKGILRSAETKEKISKTLKEWWSLNLTHNLTLCSECRNKQRDEQSKLEAFYWIKKFKESGCNSIREFVRISDYNKSYVSFSKMLKKYVVDYETTHDVGKIQ